MKTEAQALEAAAVSCGDAEWSEASHSFPIATLPPGRPFRDAFIRNN